MVLLKEMRMLGGSKVSPFSFLVLIKVTSRWSQFKISFCSVTPGVKNFSSDLLRAGWCNLTCVGRGWFFVLLGADATQGVEFENTCIVSGK